MFNKKIWQDGDIITANELNRIEDGVDTLANMSPGSDSSYLHTHLEQKTLFDSSGMFSHVDTIKDARGFLIPFMTVTRKGTIIAGCDCRYGSAKDEQPIDIIVRRSTDGGKTFSDPKLVMMYERGISQSRVMDGTITRVDLPGGGERIIIVATKFNHFTQWVKVSATAVDTKSFLMMTYSDDDGVTWSDPIQILSHQYCQDNGIISMVSGVGNGIQMQNGIIAMGIQVQPMNRVPFACVSALLISRDLGITWEVSNYLPEGTSECALVEYSPGSIFFNTRSLASTSRHIYITEDLGQTWIPHPLNKVMPCARCQGSMIKMEIGELPVFLFTNSESTGRGNIFLKASADLNTWHRVYSLSRTKDGHGYTCLAGTPKLVHAAEGNIGLYALQSTTRSGATATAGSSSIIKYHDLTAMVPEINSVVIKHHLGPITIPSLTKITGNYNLGTATATIDTSHEDYDEIKITDCDTSYYPIFFGDANGNASNVKRVVIDMSSAERSTTLYPFVGHNAATGEFASLTYRDIKLNSGDGNISTWYKQTGTGATAFNGFPSTTRGVGNKITLEKTNDGLLIYSSGGTYYYNFSTLTEGEDGTADYSEFKQLFFNHNSFGILVQKNTLPNTYKIKREK